MGKLGNKLTKRNMIIAGVVLLVLAGLGVGLYFLLRNKKNKKNKPSSESTRPSRQVHVAFAGGLVKVTLEPRGTGVKKADGTLSPTRFARFVGGSDAGVEFDLDTLGKFDDDYALKQAELHAKKLLSGECERDTKPDANRLGRSKCRGIVAMMSVVHAIRDVMKSGTVTESALVSALGRQPPPGISQSIKDALYAADTKDVPTGTLFVLPW